MRDRWALGAGLMVDADASGSLTAHRALHLHYLSLIADPVAAVAAIYRAVDAELSPAVAGRIADRARAEPGMPRAKADHRLAAYGLDGADLTERFAAYRAYFDVEREFRRAGAGAGSGASASWAAGGDRIRRPRGAAGCAAARGRTVARQRR